MIRHLFFVFLLLASCQEENDQTLIKISKESIFHDNSSKVWVISRVTKKGVNVSNLKFQQKDVAIFYKSGKVYFQPISTLGNFPEKGGRLFLSEDSKSVNLLFDEENWNFTIESISSERIKLRHTVKSDFKYDLELISYPEGD
jgi:hypothetical protein